MLQYNLYSDKPDLLEQLETGYHYLVLEGKGNDLWEYAWLTSDENLVDEEVMLESVKLSYMGELDGLVNVTDSPSSRYQKPDVSREVFVLEKHPYLFPEGHPIREAWEIIEKDMKEESCLRASSAEVIYDLLVYDTEDGLLDDLAVEYYFEFEYEVIQSKRGGE